MDIRNKNFVFTGRLMIMMRSQAKNLVLSLAGYVQSTVSAKTDFLVVGNTAIDLLEADSRTKKRKIAEELIAAGIDIKIDDEQWFRAAATEQLAQSLQYIPGMEN